jgi:hypothetical protein
MSDCTHIISLGAGVQSSTVALMAAAGEITPMPKAAVFADVGGSEPQAVYDYLDWIEGVLPFPVYRVQQDDGLEVAATRIRTSSKTGKTYLETGLPVFYKAPNGSVGMGVRQCTSDFKIAPLNRKIRELTNGAAITWIGISTDEASRMKDSRVQWNTHRWPLIELNMSRQCCLKWLRKNNYPTPPKSACVFCPYHRDYVWADLRRNHPKDFQRAVDFEKRLQFAASKATVMKGTPFFHKSCEPLDEVVFSDEERGQINLFENECEGMCGV